MRARARIAGLLLAATSAGCAGPDPNPSPALPCDVDVILRNVCQKCHGSPPREGVPISLVTYEDTQAPYTEEPLYQDTPTWQVMGDMLRNHLMPQPPVVLGEVDRATLLRWIDRGAPPAPRGTSCR